MKIVIFLLSIAILVYQRVDTTNGNLRANGGWPSSAELQPAPAQEGVADVLAAHSQVRHQFLQHLSAPAWELPWMARELESPGPQKMRKMRDSSTRD